MSHIVLKIRHYYSALGVRGVLLFIYSKITRRKPVVKVFVKDLAHPVFLRIGTTDISSFKQVLLERHYEFDKPNQAGFIVDAGANIGLSAVYFANRFPDSTIVAIEPETSNFAMLKRNVSMYPRVKPLKGALWQRNEEICLFDSGHGNHGFQIDGENNANSRKMESVMGYTVDRIMLEEGRTSVDLLKIDIEGSELEVMAESKEWIDSVGVIMIELHDDLKPGCTEAFHAATERFSPSQEKGETIMRCNPIC